MEYVKVTTITGQEVEITHEEAQRIAGSVKTIDAFHIAVKERNNQYHQKASDSIKEIAARHGFTNLHGTEEEYKKLLAHAMHTHPDIADLIVEIAEERIAHHHKKIYSE